MVAANMNQGEKPSTTQIRSMAAHVSGSQESTGTSAQPT